MFRKLSVPSALAVGLLACQPTPSKPPVSVVERGGEVLKVDPATGETAKRTAEGWETLPTVTPKPRPAAPVLLPPEERASIRVEVARGEYHRRITINNGSSWEIHEIRFSAGESRTIFNTRPFMGSADVPIAPGERRSITAPWLPGQRGEVTAILGMPTS